MLQTQCTNMKDLQKIHAHIIKTGLAHHTVAASRVLTFCASPSGDINYAYLLFTTIPTPNLYCWNTIIRGFSRSSTPHFAISLFVDVLCSEVQSQRLTYPSVFKAYAQLGSGYHGAQLHGRVVKLGLEKDQFIQNTIIYIYANSGLLSEARRLFDELVELDVVACNSMIMGLAKCGEMQRERVQPSEFTMVSLLSACAHLGALQHFELNVIVLTAIIDMYCKCGAILKAIEVFEASPTTRGLSCWNSIIIGLAMNGYERKAIEYFSKLEASDLKPDHVSFIGVLTSCKYIGAVEKARDYFALMMDKYEIEPLIKHYTCMVEVLGQAGLLEEAEELINGMPIRADFIIWGSLLSSCRKHGNVEIAKRAAQRVCELNPSDVPVVIYLCLMFRLLPTNLKRQWSIES
ncbi:Pentatricopeptide repeat-containing protein, chloroplastic [Glycine soja]|uniref:Pentatricopeptide repeat-containing protein, chloroplastic n=1 Tax=Glycine soja TaxID=3848 RepID=A0A445LVD7_GLYSO|nr:Pentatricopeptide repeat-containing protein, chloroplastic [Glycine soja]